MLLFFAIAGGVDNSICSWPTRGDTTRAPTAAPQWLGDNGHPGRLRCNNCLREEQKGVRRAQFIYF